jgi:DNA-binding CsgD family transcriptional regulator/tetratricopeptide (TPR) repeat protein
MSTVLTSSPFVGRSRELTTLHALLPLVEGEGRRLALIGGEAGSGKSRLVRELSRMAAAAGVQVLPGACDAAVRTPYQPFVEALAELVRSATPKELRADLGPAGGELARLLPDLPTRVSGLPAPVGADPDTERHRLHTAVTDLLAAASRRRPLLLVLEDGHWADTPSLLLLRHLSRSGASARLLVVATFRDTEADVPADLADSLADLRRSDDVVRLHLDALTAADVSEFVVAAAGDDGVEAPDELARGIWELTTGNAFLLVELWRALIETGALADADGVLRLTRPLGEIATPESVREVVNQRLSRLDEVTRDLLELAAVAGPEFELELLRRAAGTQLDALEPAVRSGLVEELESSALSYRFAHELVRRALYDRLTALRRAELHLQVGAALEELGPDRSSRAAADLAHHFHAALPIGSSERAVEYSLLAAAAASAALAYGDAAAHLSAALEIGIADPRRRAETLLDVGTARFRAGTSLDALDAYREAAAIARELGDGELLARAAVGFEEACWRPAMHDQGARILLDEAAATFRGEDTVLHVELLSGLGRTLDFEGDSTRAKVARDEAIAIARRMGYRRTLATVLMRAYWARASLTLPEIFDMVTEAQTIAEEIGDAEIRVESAEWRIAVLLALGETDTARREIGVVRALAERMGQPFMIHVAEHYNAALALADGRLAEAEAAAERSRRWGELLTGRDAFGVYGIQMFGLRREQGRLAELAPVVRILAGSGHSGAWRPGLAAVLAELGMRSDAERELDLVCSAGLAPLRAGLWLASLTYLADAATAVGHEDTARLVYPELAPLSGTNVMIGHGVAAYGAVDRYLGMLASTLGDAERAAGYFEAALELNRRMGAGTWVAHTACEYARLLLCEGADGRAADLLVEAETLGERLGLAVVLSRARALRPVDGVPPPDELSEREVEVLRLVARGLSNREIGAALFISEHTAANHLRSILRKTGCANRTEAAAYAFRRGLAER